MATHQRIHLTRNRGQVSATVADIEWLPGAPADEVLGDLKSQLQTSAIASFATFGRSILFGVPPMATGAIWHMKQQRTNNLVQGSAFSSEMTSKESEKYVWPSLVRGVR